MRHLSAVLVLAVLSGASLAQQSEDSGTQPFDIPIVVRETRATETPGLEGFNADVQCDANGFLYFKAFEKGVENSTTVFRLSALDRKVTKLSTDPKEFVSARGQSFFVTLEGEVYFAVWDARDVPNGRLPQLYVSLIHRDGSYGSKIKIEEYYSPTKLGAFANGNILIAGVKADRRVMLPYTVLYDSSGKKLRELQFESDLSIKNAAEESRKYHPNEIFGASGELRSVHLTKIRQGADGNLYLLRDKDPAVIYGINPTGEIISRIEIPAPMPGSGVLNFQVNGSSFILQYAEADKKKQRMLISVVDSRTGKLIRSFVMADGPRPIGCYEAPDQFTFVTTKNGKLAAGFAAP
jgi:hypothetical protein